MLAAGLVCVLVVVPVLTYAYTLITEEEIGCVEVNNQFNDHNKRNWSMMVRVIDYDR